MPAQGKQQRASRRKDKEVRSHKAVKPARLNTRTVLLILVEAMLLFSGMIAAVYLRLGTYDGDLELLARRGFYKAGLATFFCLTAFYLYDLYDFVVMHDRRELILRLVQALGLAWVALALASYALPQLMIGRGVWLIALPVALNADGDVARRDSLVSGPPRNR